MLKAWSYSGTIAPL